MTAIVLGIVVFGVGGVGIWVWSRRRRDSAESKPDVDEVATRSGRRRREE